MKNAIKILCLSGVLILGNSALAAPTKERGDVDRISSAFLNLVKEIQASNNEDGDQLEDDNSKDKDKTEQGIGSLDKLLKDLRALSGDQADAQNWLEQLQQELQRLLGGPQQAQSA